MAKKEQVQFDASIHAEELQRLIKEASNEKTLIESHNEKIKELRTEAKDNCGVDPKMFNDLLKIYHKQERERFEDDKDQVVEAYDTIFPSK